MGWTGSGKASSSQHRLCILSSAGPIESIISLTERSDRSELTESGSPERYHRRGHFKRRRDEDVADGCADRSLQLPAGPGWSFVVTAFSKLELMFCSSTAWTAGSLPVLSIALAISL